MAYDPSVLSDLLPIYYKRLFPHSLFYRWLNYGGVDKTYYPYREFSFTLKDDIYNRYLSFEDAQEFEAKLIEMRPFKIDIGAVFTHRPKDRKSVRQAAFQASEKELVFDIDMTDYDDVRSCCSGADICKKCWPLMEIGVRVTDRALRDDFGFKHRLWVYSGRRGVHCWVCDEEARKLAPEARSAIAEYLTVVKGGENQLKKVNLFSIAKHPSIQAALKIIDEHFGDCVITKQDFLSTEEKFAKLLRFLPDELKDAASDYVKKFDEDALNSTNRWEVIKRAINNKREELNKPIANKTKLKELTEKMRECSNLIEEIKFQYCYPRLDVNVTKGLNHLLKSPFCVHPKTGRVCVPFNPSEMSSFDPFVVPLISEVCVGSSDVPKSGKKDGNSSMNEALLVFKNFVEELEKSQKAKLREQAGTEI